MRVYKYPYGTPATPAYYLYLDELTKDNGAGSRFCMSAYARMHVICTLTPSSGILGRVGLHRTCVHEDAWAFDAPQPSSPQPSSPRPTVDEVPVAIRIIEAAIDAFVIAQDTPAYRLWNAFTPGERMDAHVLHIARAAVSRIRAERLAELRGSCAARAVAAAWRRCISDPAYAACRRRLLREFHEPFLSGWGPTGPLQAKA